MATRVNGKYWMFWGDVNIWAATSDDLVNWTPVEMGKDEKATVSAEIPAATMPRLKIVLAPGRANTTATSSNPALQP
jgi:hypothetical protein